MFLSSDSVPFLFQMQFEDSFRNSFGSEEKAREYARKLVTHTQSYFCFGNDDPERGLGTKFGIKVSKVKQRLSVN